MVSVPYIKLTLRLLRIVEQGGYIIRRKMTAIAYEKNLVN
jgi:hypothetical protein